MSHDELHGSLPHRQALQKPMGYHEGMSYLKLKQLVSQSIFMDGHIQRLERRIEELEDWRTQEILRKSGRTRAILRKYL